MKKDKRLQLHFARKKKHTQIKHAIFSETLKRSLFIANMLAARRPTGASRIYTYIDLFAGKGMFADDTEGSPLMARDIFEDHLTNTVVRNSFSEIRIIVTEKETDDLEKLVQLLEERTKKARLGDKLKIYCGVGSWENYTDQIKELLSESKWGFIYADPFSTELDIEALVQTISSFRVLKDIFIFANLNTLSRQAARRHENDIERVCRSLGIVDPAEIATEDFPEVFKNALKNKFSALKHFVTGVAIPITKEEKLIMADYFYLILATDSVKVADGFLDAYEDVVTQYKPEDKQQSFWRQHSFLEEKIEEFLKARTGRECGLVKIIDMLFNAFLSWKLAIGRSDYMVPNIRNIVGALNALFGDDKIEFRCPPSFLYKRQTTDVAKGSLKYSEIHGGKDTEVIKIKLK